MGNNKKLMAELRAAILILLMLPVLAFAQNTGGTFSISKQRLYDKEVEKQDFIKKLLKRWKAKAAIVEEWQDGTVKYVLTPKKGEGYTVYDFNNTDENQSWVFGNYVSDVKILTVDGKTYYHGFGPGGKEYLAGQNGKRVLNSSDMRNIEIKNYGGKNYISYDTGNFNNISDMNGKNIHYGSLPFGCRWVDALPEGETYSELNGEKIKFYTHGTRGYFTNDSRYNVDENGKEIPGIRFYTQLLDGKSGLLYYKFKIKEWKKDKVASKFGKAGETDDILYPVPENGESMSIDISTANGDTLINVFISEFTDDTDKFYYNIDEQAFHYTYYDYKKSRQLERVISLRDSALNIPPTFREAGYLRDGDKLVPYVRRTMLSKAEPYVAGMDTTANFANEGERELEARNFWGAYEYYDKLPEDHKWTVRELVGMNMATLEHFGKQLNKGYEILDGYETGKYNDKYLSVSDEEIRKDKVSYEYDDIIKWGYTSLKEKNEKIAAAATDKNLKTAATTSAGVAEKLIGVYADLCKALDQAESDYSDRKAQAEADRQIAEAENRRRAAEQAELRRQQNAQAGTAIMQAVGNTLRGIFGGGSSSKRSSGYSGGGYSGGGAATGGSSAKSSGGNLVMCSACGGKGTCNACRPYPGYASRGSNKPCAACGGQVKCKYCGGVGKVRR